jgi:hypothetical protein
MAIDQVLPSSLQSRVGEHTLKKIEAPLSNTARIARKVANVAFAAFGSLGVLLLLTATIFAIVATHGVAALLIPVVGKAAALTLFQMASTVVPIATYAAGTTLGLSALGGVTSLALKE